MFWPLLVLFAVIAFGNAARQWGRDGTLGTVGFISVGVGAVLLALAGLAWIGTKEPRGGKVTA
jgi:hypothetical protein